MDFFQNFNVWFWNEYVWLPQNITWEVIAEKRLANYAQFGELHYAFYVAAALLLVRFFLETYIFTPLGCYCGLKPKSIKITKNPILEKEFCINGKIGYKKVQGLAKQLDWSERRVQQWIRKRTARDKPSALSKFTESAWRFTFYLTAFLYGLYTLSDKSWLWDTHNCWYDYPHHDVTNDIWWYYMLELGFYWSLTFSQFMDIKRKDFLQMFVHHIVTIMLLTFSWTSNLFRVGSLVLIIHDFADVPLEAAKMAKYIEKHWLANAVFTVFTLAWIVSRLILYPCRVIYHTMVIAISIVPLFPGYYIFNSLLCMLQVLHIVWTWVIIRIAIQAVTSTQPGGVKDLRSDSEECDYSSSGGEENPNQNIDSNPSRKRVEVNHES